MLPLQEEERAPQQAVAEGLARRAEHLTDRSAHVPWRMLGDGHLQAHRPQWPWPFDPALVVRVPLGASELSCLRAQHVALVRAGEAVEDEERVALRHGGCWSRCRRCAGPVDECLAPGSVTGCRPCLCRAGLLVRRRPNLRRHRSASSRAAGALRWRRKFGVKTSDSTPYPTLTLITLSLTLTLP